MPRTAFRHAIIVNGCMAVALGACSAAPASDSPRGREYRVATAAELTRALADPAPGTVIRLAPGDYGAVVLSRKHTPEALRAGLTLTSADPANPARLAELAINGATGLTVRNLRVGCSATIQPCAMYLLSVTNSSAVTLQGVRLTGIGGGERGRQYGVFIRGSQNIKLVDSSVTATRYGVGMLDDRAVTIIGNEFQGLQTDGIRGGGVSDLLVAENILGGFTPKPKEHPDGIQLWSTGQSEPGRRITIRDNLIVRGEGGIIQGIFVRDTNRQLPFEDLKITGNLVIGAMYNGVAAAGVRGGEISDNSVFAYPDMKSYIVLRDGQGVRFSGNRAMLFLFPDRKPDDMSDNREISRLRQGDLAAIDGWLRARPAIAGRGGRFLRELTGKASATR